MFCLFQEFHNILLMQKHKRANWSPQESQLLIELVPNFTSKRWKRISQEFRKRGLNRSESECREKWVNFLAPGVNRSDWEPQELRMLYEVHGRVGTRWCQVQKSLNRSQNQIKNRFYGTLRNFIRGVLGFFNHGDRISNCPVEKLPPNYLNCLYNSTDQFSFLDGQVRTAIFEMGYKVEKQMLHARMERHRKVYTQLDFLLLKDFNQLCQIDDEQSVVEMGDPSLNNQRIQSYVSVGPALADMQVLNAGAVLLTCPTTVFWYY